MSELCYVRCSVCVAVHNGVKYLPEQLNSIIDQLGLQDELIVIDDKSSDGSVDLLKSFRDPRIRLFSNDIRLGHVKTFERAISLSRGDYILLADQDDRWTESRLEDMLQSFYDAKHPLLVVGDFQEVDTDFKKINSPNNDRSLGSIKKVFTPLPLNILLGKSKFYGCCFAFNRSLVSLVTPFPRGIEAHDIWISLVASLAAEVRLIDKVVLLRRIHGSNLSPLRRRTIDKIIKSRLTYLIKIIGLYRRFIDEWFRREF